ncbi:hypothetical protein GW17_00061848 [Ensete ventricosum]|nr:hypothetical protein GW17_00061848 [Ensete ventricosum]
MARRLRQREEKAEEIEAAVEEGLAAVKKRLGKEGGSGQWRVAATADRRQRRRPTTMERCWQRKKGATARVWLSLARRQQRHAAVHGRGDDGGRGEREEQRALLLFLFPFFFFSLWLLQ